MLFCTIALMKTRNLDLSFLENLVEFSMCMQGVQRTLMDAIRFGAMLSEEMDWDSEALGGEADDDEMRRNKPFKLLGVRTYRRILDVLPKSVSKRQKKTCFGFQQR